MSTALCPVVCLHERRHVFHTAPTLQPLCSTLDQELGPKTGNRSLTCHTVTHTVVLGLACLEPPESTVYSWNTILFTDWDLTAQ